MTHKRNRNEGPLMRALFIASLGRLLRDLPRYDCGDMRKGTG
jgi:hypothetical protein